MGTEAGDAGHRTLADQFRSWPDERLARLLRERPDLAMPVPHDSAQLASRTATRSSLSRALDRLNLLELVVLDALVVAGHTTPADVVRLVAAAPPLVEGAVERLVDLALVWRSPGGLRPLTGVADSLTGGAAAGVSGLRPLTEGASLAAAVARLDELSAGARALLEHVDSQGGTGTTGTADRAVRPEDAATPVEELIARRLLVLSLIHISEPTRPY